MTTALLGANLIGGVVGVGLSITSAVMQHEISDLLNEVNRDVEIYMEYYNYNISAYQNSIAFKSFMDKFVAFLVYVQNVDMQAVAPETFLPNSNLGVAITGEIFSLISQVAMTYAIYKAINVPKAPRPNVEQASHESAEQVSNAAQANKGFTAKTKEFFKSPLNLALLSQSISTVMTITNLSIGIDSMRNEMGKLKDRKNHLENTLIPNAQDLNIKFHQQMDAVTKQLYALGQFLMNQQVTAVERDFSSNLARCETTIQLMWKTDLQTFTTHNISGLLYNYVNVQKKTSDTLVAWFSDLITFQANDELMVDMGEYFYEYDISALVYQKDGNKVTYQPNAAQQKRAMKISKRLYNFFKANIYFKPGTTTIFDATSTYLGRAATYYADKTVKGFPGRDASNKIKNSDLLCMHILFLCNFIDKVSFADYSGDNFVPKETIDPNSI